MSKLNIIFSHGKESGPNGSKITRMMKHAQSLCDCYVHSIDYQDLKSPDDRVTRLIEYLTTLKGDIILVGSSMGGYVSTVASSKKSVQGLMLLAPAFYLEGYDVSDIKSSCKNITIIHGWNDDIVPYKNSVKFAHQHKAKLVLVDDGHRLSESSDELNHKIENIINKRKAHG